MRREPSIPASDVHPDDRLHHIYDAVRLETGRRIHKSTGIRWATKGRKGIRLKAVRMGRYLMTTRKAVRQYLAELTEAENPELCQPAPETSRERAVRADSARQQAAAILE